MLEKASLVSMYKPDRRSRVVLQEPEPEADETCMSETSADDESVAGGRSVAGTPAKPSPGGRSAHGSQTPSSASKPRGAASCARASRTQNVPRLVPLEELRSAASSRQAPGRAHAPTHAHTHASHRAGARTGAQAHLQGFEHLGDDRVRRRQAGGPEVPGLEAVTRSALPQHLDVKGHASPHSRAARLCSTALESGRSLSPIEHTVFQSQSA